MVPHGRRRRGRSACARSRTGDSSVPPAAWSRGLDVPLDSIQPDIVVLLQRAVLLRVDRAGSCAGAAASTSSRTSAGSSRRRWSSGATRAACLLDVDELWDRWRDRPLTPARGRRARRVPRRPALGQRTIDRFWDDAAVRRARSGRGSGRLVTLFTNLTWDSAVIGQELAFATPMTWVRPRSTRSRRGPSTSSLIRIHPAEVKLPGKQTREPLGELLRERFPTLPPNVPSRRRPTTRPARTRSWTACDVGPRVHVDDRTELALRGKPVIVAGRTHYRGKGFTLDVSSEPIHRASSTRCSTIPTLPTRSRARAPLRVSVLLPRPIESPGVEEHVLGLARITIRRSRRARARGRSIRRPDLRRHPPRWRLLDLR